jgi:hypothetical protein
MTACLAFAPRAYGLSAPCHAARSFRQMLEQRSRDFILNLEVSDGTLHSPSISKPRKTGMRLWAFLVPVVVKTRSDPQENGQRYEEPLTSTAGWRTSRPSAAELVDLVQPNNSNRRQRLPKSSPVRVRAFPKQRIVTVIDHHRGGNRSELGLRSGGPCHTQVALQRGSVDRRSRTPGSSALRKSRPAVLGSRGPGSG